MTLKEFRDTLLQVTEKVHHYEAPSEGLRQYIVWQETGRKGQYGDDWPCEKVWQVQVELHTDVEFDPLLDSLLEILDQTEEVVYTGPAVSFDADRKLIRYLLDCEVA